MLRGTAYVCKCVHGVCRTGCELYTSRTCAVRIGVELRGFLAPGSERRKVHFRNLGGLITQNGALHMAIYLVPPLLNPKQQSPRVGKFGGDSLNAAPRASRSGYCDHMG